MARKIVGISAKWRGVNPAQQRLGATRRWQGKTPCCAGLAPRYPREVTQRIVASSSETETTLCPMLAS